MAEIFFYEYGENNPRIELGKEKMEKNLEIFLHDFIFCGNLQPTDLIYKYFFLL
jgi:hypothetical protein